MKIDLTALLPVALKPYAKFVYFLVGVAALLVGQGVVTGDVAEWITRIVALVGTGGAVYGAENRTADAGVDETPAQDEFDADESADDLG